MGFYFFLQIHVAYHQPLNSSDYEPTMSRLSSFLGIAINRTELLIALTRHKTGAAHTERLLHSLYLDTLNLMERFYQNFSPHIPRS